MASLEGRNIPRRLEHFAGEHEWLAPALAATALGWFEVQAMKAGTRRHDPALADATPSKASTTVRRRAVAPSLTRV